MTLSQALMNQVAALTLAVVGDLVESVTIIHRETLSAAPVTYGPFDVAVGRYSDHVVAMAALTSERPLVLRDDKRVLVPTAAVTWTPTIYTLVVFADASEWRVVPPLTGGPGTPFYVLQIRKPTA